MSSAASPISPSRPKRCAPITAASSTPRTRRRPIRTRGAGQPLPGPVQLEPLPLRRMNHSHLCSRRHFLHANGFGLGSLALAWLLQRGRPARRRRRSRTSMGRRATICCRSSRTSQPKAKAMISLFMQGGPSQMDLFDPKPSSPSTTARSSPGEIKYDNVAAGLGEGVSARPWKFAKHGQCGMELSELLPHLGEVADDITLIRSMHTGVNNHGQSIYAMNTGRSHRGPPGARARGSPTASAARRRTCPRTWCSRIRAACRC